ncbi:hypothetical protein [Nocardioides bruguierae]|uniref:hypothetical protein n=1 Tax=Nocardioides bruguierae TaxID=2945102 RepID=UPI0020218776|nr:hypothetical protein [Nocardioides bruguierae]MCL8026301.1 hypothetical protein [Nocardioides bruguierae]
MTDPAPELQRAVDRLTSSIDQLRAELVRKDVYESDQRARDAQFQGLRDDVTQLNTRMDRGDQQRAADRRLILTSIIAPVIVALIMLYVAAQVGGPA